MSWANKLLETYDICDSAVGELSEEGMLLPLGHLTTKAQIEVVLDKNGRYVSANEIPNDDAVTVIPVTEDSASRSSGVTAHPLHDKLIYIAKDFEMYTNKDNQEYWKAHQDLMKKWIESEYTHPIVEIIYQYLEKGTLMNDLINSGVLVLDGQHLDKKAKIQKTVIQSEAFVRFKIVDDSEEVIEPWFNKELFEIYNKFYTSIHTYEDLCYITGQMMYCTDKHPAKLRQGKDKAKLISSNDTSGFTYRGRFVEKGEAISIGYETSQKVHNALRWLIQKQAYLRDGQTILAWNAHCDQILNPLENELNYFPEIKPELNTEETFTRRINRAIAGYKENITDHNDNIVIMAMDAATIGRFSITYYQELDVSSYYRYLNQWYIRCSWPQYSKSEFMGVIGTPLPKDIVSAAYGTLHGNFFDVKENIMSMHLTRFLPCISNGKPIPGDFISGLSNKIKIMSKVNKYQWMRLIGITCAVLKKYYYDTKGEEWSVNVMENENHGYENISYLFGRLLAVYDGIERYALNIMKVDRSTNAMRLYAHFQESPANTWMILDKKLIPYVNKLGAKCEYLLEMKRDLSEKIYRELGDEAALLRLKNLDAYFILGFDCQKNEIKRENEKRSKKNKKEEQ